jgi:hypothetical protein
MHRNTKPSGQTQTSFLELFKDAKPKGGLAILRFEEPGTAIAAEFLCRRNGIRTQIDDSASVVDVNILECSDGLTTGEHTIFLSTHLIQIFDAQQLSRGDRFYLKLYDIEKKTRFKRFVFELIGEKPQPPLDADIPH